MLGLVITTSQIALLISGLAFCWSIGWSVFQYRRTVRTKFRVVAQFAVAMGPMGTIPALSIEATNLGSSTRLVKHFFDVEGSSDVLFIVPGGEPIPSTPLPIRVEHHDSWNVFHDPARFRESFNEREGATGSPPRIRAVVQDASGKLHRSDWIRS